MDAIFHETSTGNGSNRFALFPTKRSKRKLHYTAVVVENPNGVPLEICEGNTLQCPASQMTLQETIAQIEAVIAVSKRVNPGLPVHVHIATTRDRGIAIMGYPEECKQIEIEVTD